MFVIGTGEIEPYYLLREFYLWYALQMGLPGFNNSAQENFKKYFKNPNDPSFKSLNYKAMLELKEAQQTEEKLTQSKQELSSNEQKLTEAQSNVKDCKQALKNAKSQATKDNPNTAAIEQAEANLKQAEAAEKQAKQAVEQSKEQVKTDEKANTTAKKEAESAKAESSKLQSQVDTLQKQSTDLQSAITDGNSRLETIGKEDTKTDKTDNAEKTDQSGQEVKEKPNDKKAGSDINLADMPEGKDEQLAWINDKMSEISADYANGKGGDSGLADDPVYIALMMQKDNLEGTDRTSEFLKEDQATWIDNQMSEIAADYANGKGDSSLEEDPIYSALKQQKEQLEQKRQAK